MTHNLTIEPGEITVVLAEDINTLTHHACHTAKVLADKGIGVQLLNCGMMSRRFWKIARDEAPAHITGRYGGPVLRLNTSHRGNLFADRSTLRDVRAACKTKVFIISGWEWSSKSWRLKEDLVFHLREIAEEEEIAIIIYSQARTSPTVGRFDRGGVGKLASIALSVVRIFDDEDDQEKPAEPVIISPQDEVEAEKFAQLLYNNINDLSGVRAGEEVLEPEEKLEYA